MRKYISVLFRQFMIISLISGCLNAVAQNKKISGTIRDASSKESLIGVTVMLQNSKGATATDQNGMYSIQSIGNNDTLVVSYTGYITQK